MTIEDVERELGRLEVSYLERKAVLMGHLMAARQSQIVAAKQANAESAMTAAREAADSFRRGDAPGDSIAAMTRLCVAIDACDGKA